MILFKFLIACASGFTQLSTVAASENKNANGICTERKTQDCHKEYHYCELMFAGECWITKVYTVLAKCIVNDYTCCAGYQQVGDSTGKDLKCEETSKCGGLRKLTTSHGKLSSLNHPLNYPKEYKCNWEIEAPVGYTIRLEFTAFHIEDHQQCLFDNLVVVDSVLERTFCGKRMPAPIFSSSNRLQLQFNSDDGSEFSGFSARWNFVLSAKLDAKCEGNKSWQPCVCKRAATCADPYPAECSDTNTCHAGCACPPERHLFEDGRCITIEQCPQQSTSPFCGRSGAFPHQAAARPATRIFGGRDAARGEWPWAVQLLRNRNLICGATLVSSNWVLSAAHCFLDQSNNVNTKAAQYLLAIGGTSRLFTSSEDIQMIVPNLIEPHPRFSSATNSHDIALIGIPRSVRLSEFIKPVCLPAPDPNSELAEIEEQRRRVVIGWGKAGEGTPLAKTLQKVDMAVVDDQICQDIYLIYSSEHQMCAGSTTSNADTCEGDSGGPLLAAAESRDGTRSWFVSGITSFGTPCGLGSSNYGVFTRVSAYMGWIESVCGENCSLPVETNAEPQLRAELSEIVSLKSATDSSSAGSLSGTHTQLKRTQRRVERIKLRQEARAQRNRMRAELRAKRQQQRRENRKAGK